MKLQNKSIIVTGASRGRVTQVGFEFGKGHFDWIEIRARDLRFPASSV